MGKPSLFFRFGGCNMRCEGFGCERVAPNGEKLIGCDTIYAVDKEHFKESWRKIEHLEELIGIIEFYAPPSGVDVVFTGGEPLLYANEPLLIAFMHHLHAEGMRITFETNGTIAPDFKSHGIFKEAIYALSVKLENSNEPYERRIKPRVIATIAQEAEAFFKFSVDSDSINLGLDEQIAEIVEYAPHLSVYCMPLGGSKKEIETNALPLIEYCKRRGYIYSDRLHIRIWDESEGV